MPYKDPLNRRERSLLPYVAEGRRKQKTEGRENQMRKRIGRTPLDTQMHIILILTEGETIPTKLFQKANLTHKDGTKHLNYLISKGLVTSDGTGFCLTLEGKELSYHIWRVFLGLGVRAKRGIGLIIEPARR